MAQPEITLTVQSDRHVHAVTGDGAQAFGDFTLTDLETSLVDLFTGWLVRRKVSERREMELFGTLMYRALINNGVHTLFEQTLSELAGGECLRLQLSFQNDVAGFARLPWEFLYRPETPTRAGDFLATDNDLVLSRYIPLQTGRPATLKPDKPPLRLLLAIARSAAVDPDSVQRVVEAINKLHSQIALELRIVEQPTRDDLLDALLDFRPHVCHFMTHGRFDTGRREGQVMLVKPDGATPDFIDDRSFADFFEMLKGGTRLVFVQHVDGAADDGESAANFAGLAPQLIRSGVQAVIAMQYPITNLAATMFSTRFYGALARGEPVDRAVQAARWRVRMAADEKTILLRDFGTPTLFMRSHDGIIQPDAGPLPPDLAEKPAFAISDAFTPYETGIRELLARLGPQHVRHAEALVYQQRLLENISFTRLYGDTENRRSERAEVVARLNALSMAELHIAFSELCAIGT